MQLLSTLVFVGLASATVPRSAEKSAAFLLLERAVGGVVERQLVYKTCEETFGPGWITCTPGWCYNPDMGHVCCSNGGYCDADEYCVLPNNCCKKGNSLEQCGATAIGSTIPAPMATKQPSESTSGLHAPTTPTAAATVTTTLPPVVTAGAGKNTEVGALAAIGGLVALLLAV